MWKTKRILSIFLILLALQIFITVQSSQLQCTGENASIDCLLMKDYPQITDELACQLCAVALESGKYPQKTNQYCSINEEKVRNCGLTSFAFLLASQRFLQAFRTEYLLFEHDPFNHDRTVSSILQKEKIKQNLINWLSSQEKFESQEALLQKSIVNLYLENTDESQKQLGLYLALNNNQLDIDTVKLKCRLYEKEGQFNEALNTLTQYLKEAQKQGQSSKLEPYLYHLKGNLLMHHLKFDQAILQFNKANALFRSFYQSHPQFQNGFELSNYNIALCLQKVSKFEEAIKKYSELLKTSQQSAQILNGLGNSFIEWAEKISEGKIDENKVKKGIFYLNQALNINSEYYLAHYNLGYAYLKLGDINRATQKFKQSLKVHETTQAQYGLLTAYLVSEKYGQAEQIVKKINVNQETIDDLLSVYYQYGDAKKSKKFYKQLLERYESMIKSASGHYWLAMIEFELQNYGLAIDYFLKAYDKGYSQPHLLFNLAYAYELLGQFKDALVYYEKAYKKDLRPETKQKIEECKKHLSNRKSSSQQL